MKSYFASALLVVLIMQTGSAFGFGLGVGGGYEHSMVDLDGGLGDFNSEKVTIGIALDTSVFCDQLINYRLLLSPAITVFEDGDRVYGFFTRSTVGFGIHRSVDKRVWIGPAARFAIFDTYGQSVSFSLGAGAEIGINIKIANSLALLISGGYQLCRYNITGGPLGGRGGIQHVFGINAAAMLLSHSEQATPLEE